MVDEEMNEEMDEELPEEVVEELVEEQEKETKKLEKEEDEAEEKTEELEEELKEADTPKEKNLIRNKLQYWEKKLESIEQEKRRLPHIAKTAEKVAGGVAGYIAKKRKERHALYGTAKGVQARASLIRAQAKLERARRGLPEKRGKRPVGRPRKYPREETYGRPTYQEEPIGQAPLGITPPTSRWWDQPSRPSGLLVPQAQEGPRWFERQPQQRPFVDEFVGNASSTVESIGRPRETQSSSTVESLSFQRNKQNKNNFLRSMQTSENNTIGSLSKMGGNAFLSNKKNNFLNKFVPKKKRRWR